MKPGPRRSLIDLAQSFLPGVLPWGGIYRRTFQNTRRVLDVGCGRGDFFRRLTGVGRKFEASNLVGVDIWLPYLVQARAVFHDVVRCDVRRLPFRPKSFDVVIASDVLEHVSKSDGQLLLHGIEAVAKDQVFVFTPVGYNMRHEPDDNPWQAHKSGWYPRELRTQGYTVHGMSGARILYGERCAFRLKFKFLRPLMLLLALWSHLLTFLWVERAYQMLGVKQVSSSEGRLSMISTSSRLSWLSDPATLASSLIWGSRYGMLGGFRVSLGRALESNTLYGPLIVFAIALGFRLYGGPLIEYYPDFMPIIGGDTLIRGFGYPFTFLTPIGPALLFAPVFFFSSALQTAQLLIVLFASLLGVQSYFICNILAKDRVAAILGALFVSIDPFLIYVSRVLWIDSINTFLVLGCFLAFPYVIARHRPVLFLAYNGLLVLTLLFKHYNVAVLVSILALTLLYPASKRTSLIRALLGAGPAIAGWMLYLNFSPGELSKILSGARGSVVPLIGLRTEFLVDVFKVLSSYMFSPFADVTGLSELSGRSYVSVGLSLEAAFVMLPITLIGMAWVWRSSASRSLLLATLIFTVITTVVFASFGGFHPRHLMTSRVIMISLFTIGASRLLRGLKT